LFPFRVLRKPILSWPAPHTWATVTSIYYIIKTTNIVRLRLNGKKWTTKI
jgi:hypothetical protein